MDRKSILIIVISVGLIALWGPMVNRFYPPKPAPPRTNTVAALTNRIESGAIPPASTNGAAARPVTAALVPPGTPEQLLVVSNANARYTFTSHGGGLKLVELVNYPEAVGCGYQTRATSNRLATLNSPLAAPTLALLGGDELQGDGRFVLTSISGSVRAEKQLSNGLYLVKEFQPTSNYLVTAKVRLENRGAQALALPPQEWVVGAATPLSAHDNEQMVGVRWYNGQSDRQIDRSWFDNKTLGCMPGTPHQMFSEENTTVAWAGIHNQFFTLIVMPGEPGTKFVAHQIHLPPPSKSELAADVLMMTNQVVFQSSFFQAATNLPPGSVLERQFTIFAGPKEYRLLDQLGAQFKNNIDLVMGYGGFFGFFAKALLLSMNGLHALFGGKVGYGVIIILITIILKALFWPLTQASTRSMKRMQALQPQMTALREKYKDDAAKMNKKLMEFMKENKVSPLGGCLPMLLQIPVFFGFFTMVRSAIELRGASFLWACDLSQPDTLYVVTWLNSLNIGWFQNVPINPLPLLMGVTMLWQARLTPISPGMDPAQQKMMKYMPLMFLFILYNYSAGLTLYWTVQNLLTIAQMKLTYAKTDPTAPPAQAANQLPPKKKM